MIVAIVNAVPAVFGEDFDPDTADAMDDESVRTVLIYGESIGTLVKHGLLSAELVHDWLWVAGLWSRVGPAAVRARERFGEPDIRTDTDSGAQVWSYASRANSNDVAASLFYTSAKEGDNGHFLDLKFVDGKLVSWSDADHTMPAKRSTGVNYGFTAGPGGQPVTHF